MYQGGLVQKRIRSFLADPLEINPLYDESTPNPFVRKFLHPYATTCRDALDIQRGLLDAAGAESNVAVAALSDLAAVFARLPEFIGVLTRGASDLVPAPRLGQERDLQLLVHAMLTLLYDDVRPEDPVGRHAGGSSRVDFLIRDVEVVVETKMLRKSLTDRVLGQELLTDIGRYPAHPHCKAIFFLVYDPERLVHNEAELLASFTRTDAEPAIRLLIVH
jgi:hypothetical protein